MREMQHQLYKDFYNVNENLNLTITGFAQQQNSDTTLCPMGTLKSISGKQLLSLQMIQCSLIQFFTMRSSDKRSQKSLGSFANFNVFTSGVLRARVKQLMLHMCEKSQEYEPTRDLFRATMAKVKQNLTQGNEFKYNEMHTMLELSKDVYLRLINTNVDKVCRQYMTLLYELKHNQSQQQHQKLYHGLVEMQGRYQASIENIPTILKDVFEIFVETHHSKMFIRKLQLLSPEQQLQVRQSVLKICAVCGPEEESVAVGQIGSKFINLAKLTDSDYHYEGMRICVSWFEKMLDGSAASHNVGSSQALTGKLTTRGSKSASDLRKKLLETYAEMEQRVQENQAIVRNAPHTASFPPPATAVSQFMNQTLAAGAAAMRQQQQQAKDSLQAQQVFRGSSFTMPQKKQQ